MNHWKVIRKYIKNGLIIIPNLVCVNGTPKWPKTRSYIGYWELAPVKLKQN